MARIDLAYVALGTIFLFFGVASCLVATIRQRNEVRVLVWLGLWSGMYGTSLLLRTPEVDAALPHALWVCSPFTINALRYLLVVAALLVWSELTLGRMRSLTRGMALLGLAIAAGGVGVFVATGSGDALLAYNNLLAACAVMALTTVVVVPQLSARFLVFPNRILTTATVLFTADALFRNVWGTLRLRMPALTLVDEFAFAGFLFALAYVAAQKVFANERRLLAIENELEIARQIQISILPTATPRIEDLAIAALYEPMTAVGGDFYAFVPIDALRAGFLVADVSGHGVPAALISAMLKVAMQSVAHCPDKPAEVMQGLNRILTGQFQGQYATAAYLWVDMQKRTGLYSAAGHPPLLRWHSGTSERIESNGLLFGALPDSDYPVCAVSLHAGDRLLLYTDGLVEPENAAGESFGDRALDQALRDNQACPPTRLLRHLLAEVRRWQPASAAQQDDITLIVIDVA